MSLSRLALRLAAIEALCPAAALAAPTPTFPTLAGARVFDSRVDLVDMAYSPVELAAVLAQLENKPLLCVYTEEQSTKPYGDAKYPAEEEVVTLVVETLIGGTGELVVTMPDGTTQTIGTLEAPITDRQHEGTLDWLGAQVRFLLKSKNRAPSADLFHQVAFELREIHDDPQRGADRALRLATRTLKFHVKVGTERWDTSPGTGLPWPLALVAQTLPAGSSGAQLIADLAGATPILTAVPAPIAGSGIDFTVVVDRAFAPAGTLPADVIGASPLAPPSQPGSPS